MPCIEIGPSLTPDFSLANECIYAIKNAKLLLCIYISKYVGKYECIYINK